VLREEEVTREREERDKEKREREKRVIEREREKKKKVFSIFLANFGHYLKTLDCFGRLFSN